ncbi:hypothetical protein Tco_0175290 [Tanacetum coccineum]
MLRRRFDSQLHPPPIDGEDDAFIIISSDDEDDDVIVISSDDEDDDYIVISSDIKLNIREDEPCDKVLGNLMSNLVKANALINDLRALGHDINDDYVVNLNFFKED